MSALSRSGFVVLTVLAILSPHGAPAQTPPFEGVIVRREQHGERVTTSRMLFRDGRMRMESDSGVGIMDSRARRMTILLPSARAYMEMDIPRGDASDERAPRVARTGRRETIAGISCEHWTITDDDDSTSDVCVASGINVWPYFQSFMQEGGGMRDFIRTLARDGYFPLSERSSDDDNVSIVTSVERTPPDAALFSPPAGYRRMTAEEYGREMMRANRRP